MAFIPIPGVARTVLKGTIGVQPWAVVHYWKQGTLTAAWSTTDVQTLATAVWNSWNTNMKAGSPTNVSITEADCVDQTNNSGAGFTYTATPISGSSSPILEVASLATVIQSNIGVRYRGGKPRTFWPFLVQTDTGNESQFAAVRLTVALTAMRNFVSTIETGTYAGGAGILQLVVPRFTYTYVDDPTHHKYRKQRSTLLNVYPVLTQTMQTKYGQQRNRLTV